MAYSIHGVDVAGSGTVYTLGANEILQLQTLTFLLTADNSGVTHFPEALLIDASGDLIARIPDWNDVQDGTLVTYTFGLGLEAFCAQTNDGGSVQNTLPLTVLEPLATVALQSLDGSGAVIAGDTFTNVRLWVEADSSLKDSVAAYIPYPSF